MQVIKPVKRYLHVYKKDIRFVYRDILKILFESQNGLQAFSLYSRLGIEPEVILDFVDKYKSLGIISVSNDQSRISLTDNGRNIIHSIIKDLELSAGFASNSFLSKLRFTPINKYAPYVRPYNGRSEVIEPF